MTMLKVQQTQANHSITAQPSEKRDSNKHFIYKLSVTRDDDLSQFVFLPMEKLKTNIPTVTLTMPQIELLF